MYEVLFLASARKDLRPIPTERRAQILDAIERVLARDPYPHDGNPKRLVHSPRFRLRVGVYRVLYTIEEGRVIIAAVLHRREAYR